MTTSQDLLNIVSSLNIAVTMNFIERNHAKMVFTKALDDSGFNTPRPERVVAKVDTSNTLETIKEVK